jgi:hypothetical protein
LSTPPQDSQAGHIDFADYIVWHVCVAIWRECARTWQRVIMRNNALLHASALALLAASQTHHAVEPAMEVDNLLRAGTLMQAVYILGNQ